MKDAVLHLAKALPNAGAANATASLDLEQTPGTAGSSTLWRKAHIEVAVPKLADHVDAAKTNTLTLQDSEDGVNFTNTAPLIQVQIPGVVDTGSPASVVKVPLPPGVRRYVQFAQAVPAGGGIGNNAVVNYDLVT